MTTSLTNHQLIRWAITGLETELGRLKAQLEPVVTPNPAPVSGKTRRRHPRRQMSPEARKRLSAGMKARWAKAKRQGKSQLS